ncbi:MAG: hypothetical protein ACHQD6_05885 [Steroidobacterales bacterium]|jgi:hypothetical protein
MATIRARKQSDGTTRYTVVVRIRKRKIIVHQECKTFAHRASAVTWAKHREVELEKPDTLRREQQTAITLAKLIRWYIETFETISLPLPTPRVARTLFCMKLTTRNTRN